jgi:hypothetical protein
VTIGIAAFGPFAGQSVLAGLAAAERIGHGAIGGFVSFVSLPGGGPAGRAETQNGGSNGLGQLPTELLSAPIAALMSSAANRPEPLEQFVVATQGVGLVTGHRFPNMPGRSGIPLNLEVLARMTQGQAPDVAVSGVLTENPEADAGLIAIGIDGRLGSQNTTYVNRFPGCGAARMGSRRSGIVVVRHNGIRPSRGLAWIAAEAALSVIQRKYPPDRWIALRAGVVVQPGRQNLILVDDHDRVTHMEVSSNFGDGLWHFGMGASTRVFHRGRCIGHAQYEPFLVARDKVLVSIDGHDEGKLPVRRSLMGRAQHDPMNSIARVTDH